MTPRLFLIVAGGDVLFRPLLLLQTTIGDGLSDPCCCSRIGTTKGDGLSRPTIRLTWNMKKIISKFHEFKFVKQSYCRTVSEQNRWNSSLEVCAKHTYHDGQLCYQIDVQRIKRKCHSKTPSFFVQFLPGLPSTGWWCLFLICKNADIRPWAKKK